MEGNRILQNLSVPILQPNCCSKSPDPSKQPVVSIRRGLGVVDLLVVKDDSFLPEFGSEANRDLVLALYLDVAATIITQAASSIKN